MANTILGLFDNPLDARRAMEQIRDSDLKTHDVSIISRATESGAPISSVDDVSAGEGAAVGAVWGGLVGLAALLIPGVGPFIALGALGAALTGAVTGAVVGGISAALIDFGDIPEAEAREYEAKVHAGQTLVAVKVDDENTAEARRMLVAAGANSIYDNQTDITSGQTANVVSSGPGQALERGGPPNPTTTRGDTVGQRNIDRAPNTGQPEIENTVTVRDPLLIGHAGVLPSDSAPLDPDARAGLVPTPDAGNLPTDTQRDTNMPDSEAGEHPKV
jgi:uncharacterized membrane protein